MKDKIQIKFSETVALIDAAFLNHVVLDMKGYFEKALQRSLSDLDIPILTTCLTLDAGIGEGNNEIQFVFVYDKDSAQLQYCQPACLDKELNGVAFQNIYGEYAFVSVSSEDMVPREDLYLNLLSIVADSADVKRLLVVSYNEEYGIEVTQLLNEMKNKEVIQFRMDEPSSEVQYKCEMLAFPMMQAFGIKSDELQ